MAPSTSLKCLSPHTPTCIGISSVTSARTARSSPAVMISLAAIDHLCVLGDLGRQRLVDIAAARQVVGHRPGRQDAVNLHDATHEAGHFPFAHSLDGHRSPKGCSMAGCSHMPYTAS